MKTSKRKRSPKSEPVAAVSAEPVVAQEAATEVVVAASVVAANDAIVIDAPATEANVVTTDVVVTDAAAASEPVVAEADVIASEPVVAEADVATAETVVAEAIVADAPVAAMVGEPIVVLAANCSVKDAASLKSSLIAVAQESAAVTLDASAVERVDTATMQLLCAFVRDRLARNQGIVWRGQSQALHDAVRLLGVGSLLGFDQAQGAAA